MRQVLNTNKIATRPAGRGAYGSVYKAVDRLSRRFVAIKIITLTDSDPQVGRKLLSTSLT